MGSRIASCCCGQLSIEVQGEPQGIGLCHCLACQRRTGSVFAALAGFLAIGVDILWSGLAEFIRTGDQGARFRFRFCPVCGSNVFHTEEGYEDRWVAVAIGTFADPSFPTPHDSVYDSRRRAWVQLPPGVTVYQKDPP